VLLCPWCGWGGWGGGLGFIWFTAMMLFWVLLLVFLVAGVIYVLRYLSIAFARKPVAGEDLEAEIRRLKARVEELERKGAKGG
jgi:uncharacterized membrane protein